MTQKGVGFSPDITAETEDHIANQGVFAGEVLVEGFFTNPELGRDGVHGDSAVTAGQKIGAGLAKNAVAELVTGGGRRDTRNFDGDGHCYLRNYNRFLSFSKQFYFIWDIYALEWKTKQDRNGPLVAQWVYFVHKFFSWALRRSCCVRFRGR